MPIKIMLSQKELAHSSEKKVVKILKGTTGLTQKEAIFRIIRSALGDEYHEGLDARSILLVPNRSFGRKVYDSERLDQVVKTVENGIQDGTIPSERYGVNGDHREWDYPSRYARQIVLYWLRWDKRLNGGMRPVSKPRITPRDRIQRYVYARDHDSQLRALERLLDVCKNESNEKLEAIRNLIRTCKLELLLKAFEIQPKDLPSHVLEDFGLKNSEDAGQGTKAA